MPNPLAMTASSGGATGATWRTAGRLDSETLVPPLQLVAFSRSACVDRAIVCCLAQVNESSRKEAAFRVVCGVVWCGVWCGVVWCVVCGVVCRCEVSASRMWVLRRTPPPPGTPPPDPQHVAFFWGFSRHNFLAFFTLLGGLLVEGTNDECVVQEGQETLTRKQTNWPVPRSMPDATPMRTRLA